MKSDRGPPQAPERGGPVMVAPIEDRLTPFVDVVFVRKTRSLRVGLSVVIAVVWELL